ncbi:GNAT family N-acetyltransferase [Acetobacteraceae bacterium H6797]|nr:GNAT family N-acetyltransferase [Acetobacteraceae bacterium H6797]
MTAINLRHNFTPDDLPKIAHLWAQLGWGSEDETGQQLVQQALMGSSWIAMAELNGQFAGYARALSDGVLVTYLVEVAVLPSCRRRGVGGALIDACLQAFPHTSIYADALPGILGLNRRHGLVPRPSQLTACSRGPRPNGAA